MSQIEKGANYWATALDSQLKKTASADAKSFYFNEVDEIYHKIITASANLDKLGFEASSIALLKVAEIISKEVNAEPIEEPIEELTVENVANIPDLEQEVQKSV